MSTIDRIFIALLCLSVPSAAGCPRDQDDCDPPCAEGEICVAGICDAPGYDAGPDAMTDVDTESDASRDDSGDDGGTLEDMSLPPAASGEHHATFALTAEGPAEARDVVAETDTGQATVVGTLVPNAALDYSSSFGWGRPYTDDSTSTEWTQISDTALGNSTARAAGLHPETGEPYLLARWTGQATFGDVTLGNAESDSMMALVRYNVDGSVRWAIDAGHFETFGYGELTPNDLAVDENGATFSVGSFTGTVDFGREGPDQQTLDSGDLDNEDIFVALYDDAGTLADAYSRAGPGTDRALTVATSPSSWCIGGAFEQTVTFGVQDAEISLTAENASDGFLECLTVQADDSLEPWVRHLSSAGNASIVDVATDASDSVWVAGEYVEDATLAAGQPGEVVLPMANSANVSSFLAKFDSDGVLQWHHVFQSTQYVNCGGLAVDPAAGTAMWVGTFNGELTVGDEDVSTAGGTDIAAAVFETDGTLRWVTSAGGPGDDTADAAALDGARGLGLVTGSAEAGATFGAGEPREGSFDHEPRFAYLSLFRL